MTLPQDPVIDQVREAAAKAGAEDAAAAQALANPLPGPTAKALAVNQSISIERWRVRPLCDGDFEVLVELDHPIRRVMEIQFDMAYRGKESSDKDPTFGDYTPRGPSMWQLAWIFTRPPKMVRDTIRHGGIAQLKVEAENEFYEQPAPLLIRIYFAIAEQITNYWAATQGYKTGEDAAADAPQPPFES